MRPTGEQHVIEAGPYRAVAVEVGGGLREASVDGRPLLDGYAEDALPDGGRGQVLAPWPNRLRDGRWTWQGRTLQLPLSEPAKGNASHGLVRWAGWSLVERDASRVVLAHRLHPQPGYPFRVDLRVEHAVDADSGLSVVLTAVPVDGPAPVALGMHPYLAPPRGSTVDACVLQVPARTVLRVDERSLPTTTVPVTGEKDLRDGALLGSRVLDDAYTDLAGTDLAGTDLAGTDLAGTQVRLSAGGRTTVLTTDAPWLQVFTGDTLAPARRRQGLAVEPLTAPADALNATVAPAALLEPGQELALRWQLRQEEDGTRQ